MGVYWTFRVAAKVFSVSFLAFHVGYVAVAPHIDGDNIKVFAGLVGDFLLAEVFLEQLGAIRAAILIEIQHHALVGVRGFLACRHGCRGRIP